MTHTRQVWKPSGRETPVACAACGKSDAGVIAQENGYQVRECSCGLIYVSPQPTDEDLTLFYSQYFPEESGELWEKIMRRNTEADVVHIAARLPAGRALDIGCGYAHFLAKLKQGGWSVEGLDLSPEASRQAKSLYGIAVANEMFRPGLLAASSFDLVTAWYVLEHVKDPAVFLAEAFRVLKPGGWLGLRVPNMAFARLFLGLKRLPGLSALLWALGVDADGKSSHFNLLDPPAHLYGYSPKTMGVLLKRAGFENADVLSAKPVDVGSLGTRLAKNVLFAVTGANNAPAITVFSKKPSA